MAGSQWERRDGERKKGGRRARMREKAPGSTCFTWTMDWHLISIILYNLDKIKDKDKASEIFYWQSKYIWYHNHGIMANMHELLIVLKLTYSSLISLAVCMSIVSTVHMPAAAAWTLNLLVLYYYVDHTSCSNSPLRWQRPRSVESTTRLWQIKEQTSSLASLETCSMLHSTARWMLSLVLN